MTYSATASEVNKHFGQFHDKAMVEPVRVTKHGRETVFIVSAERFHQLRQGERAALAVSELSTDELALIAAAEVPAHARYTMDDDR